jgi:hypothetical protein
LIGFALFGCFVVAFFTEALRSVREHPSRISALGAALVWFIAAAFDGYQQSGGFLSVGAITFVMACRPTPAIHLKS